MCVDSLNEDFDKSHLRVTDLPALLLLHRPIRCRLCHERSFRLVTAKRMGIPYLWMHYALLVAILIGAYYFFWAETPRQSVSRQVRPAELKRTSDQQVTTRSL